MAAGTAKPEGGSRQHRPSGVAVAGHTDRAQPQPAPAAAERKYSPWETTLVGVGSVFFLVMLPILWEWSSPFRAPLILVWVLGLGICALSLAGLWPFPSPFFPKPNFSSRNLRRHQDPAPPRSKGIQPFSRAAILGVVWIGLFFLNWIVSYTPPGWALTRLCRNSPLNLVTELVLFLPLMVLGFGAVMGGSVMGGVALQQIRQARGSVRGFRLALFDLLFFPLFLLNGWMVWLAGRVLQQAGTANNAWIFFGFLVGVTVNVWLIRGAKRAATRFVQMPAPAAHPNPVGPWRQVLEQTVLRLVLVFVAQLALSETLFQISVHWKESTSELWEITLAVVTLAALIWACSPAYRLKGSWVLWAGGTALSFLLLLGLGNYYSWYLRPNLGLYREPDWVAEHPGFQKQLRERIDKNLWHPEPAVSPR